LALSSSQQLHGAALALLVGHDARARFFSMATACSGMSGRLQASGAGDRSSVLVSPVTLNTVTRHALGTSGRLVNHSASAQLCSTALALALPLSAFSLTSWNWSNISSVFFSAVGRDGADLGVVEQVDQRADVVAAQHGAQQLGGLGAADDHALLGAVRHGGQVAGLHLGRVVHAGRHAVRDEVQQEVGLAGRWGSSAARSGWRSAAP
jgi:hypothetical protein